ncbi:MAG: hypothetical protein HYZ37_06830 [Candidatus Solibacter usitatus]|nr:hypothetical protein [Candidatus Solibacter usitatus]
MPLTHSFLGLDLGQRSDYSALSILEFHPHPSPQRHPATYEFLTNPKLHILSLTRFPLGTPYPKIAQAVRDHIQPQSTLVVDATGPGLPFLDFLTTTPLPANLIRILITSSGTPHYTNGHHYVSRRALLLNLAVLAQNRRLSISPTLTHTKTLLDELSAIRHDGSSTAPHDDFAIATSLAAWQAAKRFRKFLNPAEVQQ